MKKYFVLFLTGMLLFTLASCGNQTDNTVLSTTEPTSTKNNEEPIQTKNPQSEATDESETNDGENKILVAYFSSYGNIKTDENTTGNIGKGNTKFLAEMIQTQVGGDLFFIEVADKYSANYREAIDEAMQELRNDTRPALASHVENIDEYDIVFIGYPNWWGTFPQAILTFVEEYDLSNKTVIPFCTYEDSGIGSSIRDMEKALPNTTILKEFSVADKNLESSEDSVKEWLSELGI